MRKSTIFRLTCAVSLLPLLAPAQDITAFISQMGSKPALAVTDFRGSGSQQWMAAFNSTLFSDLDGSGLFDMRSKSVFPLNNPQRPKICGLRNGNMGYALIDWAGSPVNASHIVFGYTAAQNGALVLYGNVYDTRQSNTTIGTVVGPALCRITR